ncbi:efflux RND transporter permease subunit [Poriferisphaera sp. WC338]|uniref:efflux RND transporter permease subunit n=1 Tax=Poriferisphaera sp. WC338 TaxID=3425129 RepID=UPI003D81695E
MLSRLIEFALKNRVLVLLLFTIACAAGVYRLVQLPIDAFPDTTPVQVQINTVTPALSPEEIEQQITLPVELSIGGLPGLQNVRSISKFGFSQIVASFDDETNIIDARQYITERLSAVQLPEGVSRPELGPIATGLGEIFHYTIRSSDKNRSIEELRTIHDWVIKPELRKVPGVAEVNSWGGKERQYHIVIKPESLIKYDFTMDQVLEAIRRNNANVGGGQLVSSGEALIVRGLGRVSSIAEIESIVIATSDGMPVLIRDVAEIEIGHEIRRGAVSAFGEGEAVLGLAFMLMGENSQKVTRELRERLWSIKPSLPKDVAIEIVYDRATLVDKVILTVRHNLVLGAVLVVVVLLLLLGNFRAGLLVAAAIPISGLFAVQGMYEFGIAASLLSLGAIDFGILVDGSVVMTEANLRELKKRQRELGRKLTSDERLNSIAESSAHVVRPIVFGMAIIALVFVPVLTLEGTEGKLFRPMAWTFIFALAGALLVAIFLSPVLSYYFLPRKCKSKDGAVSQSVTSAYGWLVGKALNFRWVVLILVLGLLGLAGYRSSQMGGEFVPRLSEGAIVINAIRLAGVSIDESVRYNTKIETTLKNEFPDEIQHIWSRIGTAEVATDPMGTELTDIFITLHPRPQWTRATTQAGLVAEMEEVVSQFPGLNMIFTQPIELRMNEMESGIRSDIGIKVYGDDFDELLRISDEVQRVLLEVSGVSDISVDQITGQPALNIAVDQARVARYGVASQEVLDFVEAIGGIRVGEVFEGQRIFPLVVRLPQQFREDVSAIQDARIPTEGGVIVPLSSMASIEMTDGASTISREWGRRLIRVQCNVVNRDPVSFVAEAKAAIDSRVALTEGYVLEWGGQFENFERAKLRLSIIVPAVLVMIFFLLYFSMKSLRDVLIIYTGIPFAAVGAVFALWLRDIPFSVSAAVGFIALSGIAVLNGQILMTAMRDCIREGLPRRQGIIEAAKTRLRPVLATAITDAAGFIPMAISTGVGSEVQRPLATVVIGGIITSTVLTLFVLPAVSYVMMKHTAKTEEELLGQTEATATS